LEQRKEMLTELSLVNRTDWRKVKQMVLKMAMKSVLMMDTRLEQRTETNLAHLREMPKELSLVCLSDGMMAMQTVEMMEMGWV